MPQQKRPSPLRLSAIERITKTVSKVVDRVKHLVELAVRSTSEFEAQNAALEACRTIARHGLVVTEKVEKTARRVADEVKREVENAVGGAAPSAENTEKLKRAVSRGVGKAAEHLVEEAIANMFGGKRR